MSHPIGNDDGTGFSATALSTVASATTREGTALVLARPLANWGVTAISDSTGNTVVLRGWASTSTDAAGITILTSTAPAAGITAVSTAPYAVKMVRLDVDEVSSSGGVSAWVTGAP